MRRCPTPCALATGGGFAVRKLYTDGDLYVMTYTRPFMINGIGGYANAPDLMERAILLLPSMPVGGRKTEEELLAEFERMLPGILGALYDGVAHALRGIRHHRATPPSSHGGRSLLDPGRLRKVLAKNQVRSSMPSPSLRMSSSLSV